MGTGSLKTRKLFLVILKIAILTACGVYLFKSARGLKVDDFKWSYIWFVFAGAVIYFISTFILANNWRLIILLITNRIPNSIGLAKIYFESVPAKYLPSNVLHMASRHYLLKKSGYSNREAFASNVLEIAFVILSSSLLLFAGIFKHKLVMPEEVVSNNSFLAILSGVFIVSVIIPGYFWYRGNSQSFMTLLFRAAVIVLLYSLFLAISGLIFYFVCKNTVTVDISELWLNIIFAYVCAWVLGLITPGAPGGIGVREVVMVALLAGYMPKEEVLLSSVLFRFVTVAGELLGFAFASRLPGIETVIAVDNSGD